MAGQIAAAGSDADVDVVVVAKSRADLSSFLQAWSSTLQRYHLIVIALFDQEENQVTIPPSFRSADVYTHQDLAKALGSDLLQQLLVVSSPPSSSSSPIAQSYVGAWKSLGLLISRRRFVCTFDTDCIPLQQEGLSIDPVQTHLANLTQPSTPFFFNTLYDPYRKGTDFVRGYPFSLREGVTCAVSQGLWLNLPDYDAPTHIVKPSIASYNSKYVDTVLTIPKGSLFPMSSINIAFDRKLMGIAMFFCGGLCGSTRYESLDDTWAGLCCKVICDHLGYGIKSGLPYVQRNESQGGRALESLVHGTEPRAVHWLEELVPFFQALRLPRTALSVEDCYMEITKQVKEGRLNHVDPLFQEIGGAMEAWIKAWHTFCSA